MRSRGSGDDQIGLASSAEELNHPDNLQALCWACHTAKTDASLRAPTAQEKQEIEAILARIDAHTPARVCDEPDYDWRSIRARRAAIALAVRHQDETATVAAQRLDHGLARRWRDIPGISRRTAALLAQLGVLNFAQLAQEDADSLLRRAHQVGLTPTLRRIELDELIATAARTPACFR